MPFPRAPWSFPQEPIVRVTAPLAEAQFIETALLNILNFQTLIATKAARVCIVAGEDPVIEFGVRRAHGPDGGSERFPGGLHRRGQGHLQSDGRKGLRNSGRGELWPIAGWSPFPPSWNLFRPMPRSIPRISSSWSIPTTPCAAAFPTPSKWEKSCGKKRRETSQGFGWTAGT